MWPSLGEGYSAFKVIGKIKGLFFQREGGQGVVDACILGFFLGREIWQVFFCMCVCVWGCM